MPEQFTDLKLEDRGRNFGTIRVPFTEGQVDSLRTARKIMNSWWEIGKVVSGYHRDLSTGGLSIPWGTMLLHKEAAEEDAKNCFEKIQGLLEKPKKNNDLISIEEDLKKIAECLVEVFPKIVEDNKSSSTSSQ